LRWWRAFQSTRPEGPLPHTYYWSGGSFVDVDGSGVSRETCPGVTNGDDVVIACGAGVTKNGA